MSFVKNVITWGLLVGAISLFGYFNSATRDESGEVVSEGSISVFSLRVGDCLVDESDETETAITSTTVTPCDTPHDYEVFHDFEIAGSEYPGEEVVSEQAVMGCFTAFQEKFAVPYEQSILDITFFSPTRESWAQRNDKLVSCLVFLVDESQMQANAKAYDLAAE